MPDYTRLFLKEIVNSVVTITGCKPEEVYLNDINIQSELDKNFLYRINSYRSNNKFFKISHRNEKEKEDIYYFYADQAPYQCGTVIIYGAELINNKFGKFLPKLLDIYLHTASFTTAICSTASKNGDGKMEKILEKNGWKNMMSFENANSGNICTWWGYERKKL